MELNKLLIKSKMNKAYNEASNHLKIWQDTYYAILFFFFFSKTYIYSVYWQWRCNMDFWYSC